MPFRLYIRVIINKTTKVVAEAAPMGVRDQPSSSSNTAKDINFGDITDDRNEAVGENRIVLLIIVCLGNNVRHAAFRTVNVAISHAVLHRVSGFERQIVSSGYCSHGQVANGSPLPFHCQQ